MYKMLLTLKCDPSTTMFLFGQEIHFCRYFYNLTHKIKYGHQNDPFSSQNSVKIHIFGIHTIPDTEFSTTNQIILLYREEKSCFKMFFGQL